MSTAYLHRTTTSTGSNTTATFSGWVKRAAIDTRHVIWAGWESSSERMVCGFESTNRLQMQIFTGGTAHDIETSRLFTDVGAWYHIVFQFDTSNASEPERFKMWVNGVQETAFNVDDTISQDIEMKMWGSTSQETIVGARKNTGYEHYFNGCMSNIHIIDGTVYAPTEFGEIDATSGMWKFKNPSGLTYGTNGTFLLDNGAVTTDSSSNSNNYSTGGTITKTEDNPSNNYSTWNYLVQSDGLSSPTFLNGATFLQAASNTPRNYGVSSMAMPRTGKYFSEHKIVTNDDCIQFGIVSTDEATERFQSNTPFSSTLQGMMYVCPEGKIEYNNANEVTGLTTAGNNDIVGLAIDMDDEKMYIYVNGALVNSGGTSFTSKVTGNFVYMCTGDGTTSGNDSVYSNFGNGFFGTTAISSEGTNASNNGLFEYDVPAGFGALCTKQINS